MTRYAATHHLPALDISMAARQVQCSLSMGACYLSRAPVAGLRGLQGGADKRSGEGCCVYVQARLLQLRTHRDGCRLFDLHLLQVLGALMVAEHERQHVLLERSHLRSVAVLRAATCSAQEVL